LDGLRAQFFRRQRYIADIRINNHFRHFDRSGLAGRQVGNDMREPVP
jgi:hypothetical protein